MAAGLALAGCSQKSSVERTSQDFNSLPKAVQQTVRSHAPNAEIASVDRKTREGMNYYVIEFKEPGRNPKITVAEDGTLLKGDTKGIAVEQGNLRNMKFEDLPAAVRKTVRQRAPDRRPRPGEW